jgi:hypothetical protein
MFTTKLAKTLLRCLMALAELTLLMSLPANLASSAQGNVAYIREVRALDTNDLGLLNPAGLAYSPHAGEFIALKASPPTPL